MRPMARGIRKRTGEDVQDLAAGLVMIDEAERLSGIFVEWVRDELARRPMDLVVTGKLGIGERLPRSDAGSTAAWASPPSAGPCSAPSRYRCRSASGGSSSSTRPRCARSIAAFACIAGAALRLPRRLCAPIERPLKIHELTAVTAVVEAARSAPYIGAMQPHRNPAASR